MSRPARGSPGWLSPVFCHPPRCPQCPATHEEKVLLSRAKRPHPMQGHPHLAPSRGSSLVMGKGLGLWEIREVYLETLGPNFCLPFLVNDAKVTSSPQGAPSCQGGGLYWLLPLPKIGV